MAKVFLDTNILIYTLDRHDPIKQEQARNILRRVVESHYPVISTQILQEFYVAATMKLQADPLVVKSILHAFENMEIVQVDPRLIQEAIDTAVLHRISFWDALVVAAAESARCEWLFSEDLNSGQLIRGVSMRNPFSGPVP